MNTYNVYIGEKLLIEDCPEIDLKHKLEFIRAYFTHYPEDELRKEEILVKKNDSN